MVLPDFPMQHLEQRLLKKMAPTKGPFS